MTQPKCRDCAKVAPAKCRRHIVSDPADTLESLVQRASTPNLADLFRKAKARGVIVASEYGGR